MTDYTLWFKKYIRDNISKIRKGTRNLPEDYKLYKDNKLSAVYAGNGMLSSNFIFGATFRNLPEKDNWELLNKLNNENNTVGVFKLPTDKILYTLTVTFLLEQIYKFFHTYAINPNIISEKEKLKYVRGQIHEVPQELIYTKFFSLTRDYFLNDRKFKFPVTAHYIPDKDKWRLHPGGYRQVIFGLFEKEDITVLGLYNKVRDKNYEYLTDIKSNQDVIDYFNIDDDVQLTLGLTGLGGRLLPNFAFDYVRYHSAFPIEFTDLIEFLDGVNIGSNFNFYHNSRKQLKVNRTIYIKAEDPTDLAQILKALLILPFFDSPQAPSIEGITFEIIEPDKAIPTAI